MDKNNLTSFTFFVPSNYKSSREKIEKFFPFHHQQSALMPVVEKRFPQDFFQATIHPFPEKKYKYLIALKPTEPLTKLDQSLIHMNNCLIKFYHNPLEPDEILATLYVQVLKRP